MSSQCFDQEHPEHPVSPAHSAPSSPSTPCHPGSPIVINDHLEGSLVDKQAHHGTWKEGDRSRATINKLPDVALLTLFDFCLNGNWPFWCALVHVCRSWRNIIFGSPLGLHLQLLCKASTPVRETLDAWPSMVPIAVWDTGHEKWGMDNIVAVLEHNDRIRLIHLCDVPSSQLEVAFAAMQQEFPILTCLRLRPSDETALVIPASLLGGSAPRMDVLQLSRISFPGLTKLLLTATDLVILHLSNIPYSGYISPEAMVTCLSVSTGLKRLFIGFESPRCRPDRKSRRPLPQTRTVFPALIELNFNGVCEYLEDLVARINAPLLEDFEIGFFHQLIFDTPQLTHFISRTLNFDAQVEAHASFSDEDVSVKLSQAFHGSLYFEISCRHSDWQLSSIAQVCNLSLPQASVSAVEQLYILEGESSQLRWQDDIESSQWSEVLLSFTAVKDLYISREFAPCIAPALQELVGERITEVLPALQTIFLEETQPSGPVQEIIGKFSAARQLSGHPIAVSPWERKKPEVDSED